MTEVDKLIKHLFYCEFSVDETWVEVKNRYDYTVSLEYILFRFREYEKEFNDWVDAHNTTISWDKPV